LHPSPLMWELLTKCLRKKKIKKTCHCDPPQAGVVIPLRKIKMYATYRLHIQPRGDCHVAIAPRNDNFILKQEARLITQSGFLFYAFPFRVPGAFNIATNPVPNP